MSPQPIVYLDQNYLSNMAKARHGFMKDEGEAIFWRSLFDDLKKAVCSDSIRIPMSEFHEIETSLNTKIQVAIKDTLIQLSGEFQFQDSHSILEWQIEAAITQFGGRTLTSNYHPIFQSNPNIPIKDRFKDMIKKRGTISLTSYQVADPDYVRELKVRFVNLIEQSLEKCSDIENCSPNLILSSKIDWLSSSLINDPDMWAHIIQDIEGLDIQESVINDYWNTGKLLDTPFIDIFSSLFAILYFKYKKGGQSIKRSDLFDIKILATVLPYCSIVTTDKSMKEILVNRLHFDDKYKAMIFVATKTDRLAFQKFVREL